LACVTMLFCIFAICNETFDTSARFQNGAKEKHQKTIINDD